MKKTVALGLVLAFGLSQPSMAQQVGGFDTGSSAFAEATPANSSHASGVSLGGLFQIPIARVPGGSGIITNLLLKSAGGATSAITFRLWDVNPVNTTCTDNSAFAGSDTDDKHLIATPFTLTPAAPSVTTGDSATYATATNLSIDFKNQDTNLTKIVYACLVLGGTDTADEAQKVRLTLSGPVN